MSKQKLTVFALFFAILVDALGLGVAYPVLVPIVLKNSMHLFSPSLGLPIRNFLYELSLSMYCIFMFLMSPILGSLSDKYGRKAVLVGSMLGNFGGFAVSGLSLCFHSFTGLLIGRAIAGATAGSLPIAQAAVVDISDDSQIASRMGLLVLANVCGFAIGPVIGGFFMDASVFHHIYYQVPFFIVGVMGLIGAFLLIRTFTETFHGNRQLKINIITGFVNLIKAFSAKETIAYCTVLLLFLLGWGMFFATMPVLLTDRFGWGGASVGYFITYIAAIFAVVIMVVMPRVTARISLSKIVLTALIFLFAEAVLFPIVSHADYLWYVILLAISVPFVYVGLVTLLSKQVSAEQQGQIMGVTGSVLAFTMALGPIFTGILLNHSLTAPYVVMGAIFLLAIILFSKKLIK